MRSSVLCNAVTERTSQVKNRRREEGKILTLLADTFPCLEMRMEDAKVGGRGGKSKSGMMGWDTPPPLPSKEILLLLWWSSGWIKQGIKNAVSSLLQGDGRVVVGIKKHSASQAVSFFLLFLLSDDWTQGRCVGARE